MKIDSIKFRSTVAGSLKAEQLPLHLKRLDVSECGQLDVDLVGIATRLPHLVELRAWGCRSIFLDSECQRLAEQDRNRTSSGSHAVTVLLCCADSFALMRFI